MRRFISPPGWARPVSIREISISFAPTFSASCSWVMPRSTRAAKNWVYVVKVGDYTYTGYADRVGGIFAAKGPQQKDWPLNSTIEVNFHHRMGSLYMDVKSPTGKKEDDLWVFSKKGADGRELCGSFKCAKAPGDAENK